MPIYEYVCNACSHTLEALQAISEAPLQECPQCGQAQLRKLISAPIFRLKGAGWYETDFKTDNKRNLAGERGGENKPAETKASEGKPSEGKSSEGKSSEGKSSEGKSSEGKSGEKNSGEGKSATSKTSGSKPEGSPRASTEG
ncbi:MAG: zinc ribbon domain-containing protein [Nitrococcus sp.]|nr:zinc ribbon domain-containing protein [Nitrococcus sp.]